MEQTAIPIEKLGIPKELERYVAAESPREVKLMAAQGLIPAPPRALIAIQYCLLGDPDPQVAQTSREGLLSHPFKVLERAVDDETHPKVLEFLAFNYTEEEALIEMLILRRQTNDRTMCYLAEVVGSKLVEMIASNQQRLLMTPVIFTHLRKNPHISKAVLDRAESFLRIYHLLDEQEVGQAEPRPDDARVVEAPSLDFEYGFEEDEDEWPDEFVDEDDEEDSQGKKKDMWQDLTNMNVGQKIKLAFFGNASVRAILVRDTNKVVATAVMKSPRLTDSEVIAIARNRNVCDDVLREISRNKEWFKSYPVKIALVNNPKTPVSVSIPLVNQLMMHDLKRLALNRNVPSVIQTSARQALKRKSPQH